MKNLSIIRRQGAWFLAGLMLIPTFILSAATPGQLTGELWMSGAATVNGKTAVTGLTVLSGNRIQTGKDGIAVINLGKLGRIKLQPETDLVLNFTDSAISGNLNTGLALVNASEGVAVNLKTPCGEAVADQQILSSATLETAGEETPDTVKQAQSSGEQKPGRCPRLVVPISGGGVAGGVGAGGFLLPALLTGGAVLGTVLAVVLLADANQSGININTLNLTTFRPN